MQNTRSLLTLGFGSKTGSDDASHFGALVVGPIGALGDAIHGSGVPRVELVDLEKIFLKEGAMRRFYQRLRFSN